MKKFREENDGTEICAPESADGAENTADAGAGADGTEPNEPQKRERAKKEPARLYGARVSSLLLLCYATAFCGWLIENVFRTARIGVFDSRRQLLPFLAAYGFGFFVMYWVFGTPGEMRIFSKRILPEKSRRNLFLRVAIYYVLLFVLILFGEMAVGLFFEKVFGVKAWNYNRIPLHITQYTSVPTTFGFATGITLLMQFVFRPVLRQLERIPQKVSFYIALVLGVLIAADYCLMLGTLAIKGSLPFYWEIIFPWSPFYHG